MKRVLLALAASVVITGGAAADAMDNAMAAEDRGDYATAARLYRPLAERGNSSARDYLGALYLNGRGVPRDYSQAMRWFLLAAEQQHAAAQYSLGLMFERGQGTPPDLVQAYMWLTLAAARWESDPQLRGYPITARNRVATRMMSAQIAEAQRLAREWDAAHPVAQR